MLKKYEKIPSIPNIQYALSNGNFIENSYNNNKNNDNCNSLNIDYKVINGRNTDNQLDLNKLNKIKITILMILFKVVFMIKKILYTMQ